AAPPPPRPPRPPAPRLRSPRTAAPAFEARARRAPARARAHARRAPSRPPAPPSAACPAAARPRAGKGDRRACPPRGPRRRAGGSSRPDLRVRTLLQQLPELLARQVQARPDGAQRAVLDARDLLARIALDLEQDEGRPQLLAHARHQRLHEPPVLLFLVARGR